MNSNEIMFTSTPVMPLHALCMPLVDHMSRIIAALDLRIPLTDEDAEWVKEITSKVVGS